MKNLNFLWVDCEMTGLDINKDYLIEIAVILTDENLNFLYKNEAVFKLSEEILLNMNEYCLNMHKSSDLFNLSLNSGIKYVDFENKILNFLEQNTLKKNVFLAGNSVHYDFNFIRKFLPNLSDWLHYRILDISTLKLIYSLKNSSENFIKKKLHRAKDDILESIEEYKFYLENLIKN